MLKFFLHDICDYYFYKQFQNLLKLCTLFWPPLYVYSFSLKANVYWNCKHFENSLKLCYVLSTLYTGFVFTKIPFTGLSKTNFRFHSLSHTHTPTLTRSHKRHCNLITGKKRKNTFDGSYIDRPSKAAIWPTDRQFIEMEMTKLCVII